MSAQIRAESLSRSAISCGLCADFYISVDNGAITVPTVESKPNSGRFQKGNQGKRFGSRNKRTEYLEAVGPRVHDLLNALMDRAIANDTMAAKLILDRIWPVYTASETEILLKIEGLNARLERVRDVEGEKPA